MRIISIIQLFDNTAIQHFSVKKNYKMNALYLDGTTKVKKNDMPII